MIKFEYQIVLDVISLRFDFLLLKESFMPTTFNFKINADGIVSKRFLDFGLYDFKSAAEYIQHLPYKRNSDKEDPLGVFKDLGGTCSTKHALLKNLALENDFSELQLMVGIFRMNKNNTAKIVSVLEKYDLQEMPEAHNYLRYQNEIFDYTRKNSSSQDFINDMVQEIEIQPSQIINFKTEYHREFLEKYIRENPSISLGLDDFWNIREECILALQQ